MKNYSILGLLGIASAIRNDPSEPQFSTGGLIASNGNWIPNRYATEDDDQLMKNLIEQGLAYTKDEGFDSKYPF